MLPKISPNSHFVNRNHSNATIITVFIQDCQEVVEFIMNILPKKRWHVRTKDNIARVRRDEALAAEEEKKKQMRIQIAESEARTEALRQKAQEKCRTQIPVESFKTSVCQKSEHVNLFYELEQNEIISNKTNEEYEKEKKNEKEKYEKQIGYLTYLGQDTNELTGEISWYNKPKKEMAKEHEEVSQKQKKFEDPLEDIRKYLGFKDIKTMNESGSVKCEKVKEIKKLIKKLKESDSKSSLGHKKHKKHKKSKHKSKKKKYKTNTLQSEELTEEKDKREKNIDLERLRAERIKREREERKKADEVFARLNGVAIKKVETEPEVPYRYNSQFNPHLAKQNFINK